MTKSKIEKIIARLEKLAKANEDLVKLNNRSVVICALISKTGKVYEGINVSWWHSTCAEVIALGNALKDGEREFEYLFALKLDKRTGKCRLVSPCGICREMFCEFNQQDLKFVMKDENGKFVEHTIRESLLY